MQGLKQLQNHFVETLAPTYGTSEAKAMFRLLSRDRSDPSLLADVVSRIIPELLSGRPFQYVLGEAWFYGLPLTVDESVLIPRPETEELVHRIIGDYRNLDAPRIIDIGTGSGCIALALKKSLPEAEVYALDVSGAALKTAKKNAINHRLDINFIQADILEWELVFDRELRFDVVVSNPPYITSAEKKDMAPHVILHEPELALFAPEGAPLIFYQHIADFARQHLQTGGCLYFEINRSYGNEVADLLRKKGFGQVDLHRDMQGADRIITAR